LVFAHGQPPKRLRDRNLGRAGMDKASGIGAAKTFNR
jgi:hypothetical protein